MPRKSVLIIDESELFRDYLRTRLARYSIDVDFAINGLDGLVKIRNTLPDLVILDYNLTRKSCKEVLEEKSRDPNTADIPVILTAHKLGKNRLLELVPFNIRKVFMKPIKEDQLYQTLGELLGVRFQADPTPCIIEAHVNDNIIFIEIAQGLNPDKIELLRFKIEELLNIYGIAAPRVLVMMTDMELSFVDGPNVETLIETVLEASHARTKYVKLLTNSSFVREFVRGRASYADIEVTNNLQNAVDRLLADVAKTEFPAEGKHGIISDRILSAQAAAAAESIEMRFEGERKPEFTPETAKELSIAIVDDDFVIQELVKTTFESVDAKVVSFPNGRDFLNALAGSDFDIVFLDILMPEVNGFQVLQSLHELELDLPIIVLSAVSRREAVVRAFQHGVKSYLIKPLKPDLILKKTFEILNANF